MRTQSDAQSGTAARRSTRSALRRWSWASIPTALAAAVAVLAGPAVAQADPVAMTVSVAGSDATTFGSADIVSGTAGNSLLVRYTFTSAVTDGSLTVHLPTRDWPTPLHPEGAVNPELTATGSAIVRPSAEAPAADDSACPWSGDNPEVDRTPAEQTVDVAHVTCAAGQHLDVRVLDVRAPNRPGAYYVQADVTGADSGAAEVVAVQVVPTPAVTLQVVVPYAVTPYLPFQVRVTALRDGRIDTGYRGTVAVQGLNQHDCAGAPGGWQFTAADAGTAIISVTTADAHRLLVRDVAHGAVAGRSNWYHLIPLYTDHLVCPVSYH